MRCVPALVLLAIVSDAGTSGAQAELWFSQRGSRLYVTGNVGPSDDTRFAAILAEPRAPKIRTVVLSGPGGHLRPAMNMGQMIRKARLDTAVEGDRAYCDSACNMMFAAGVRRFYVRGDSVREGYSTMTGLGFHPAWTMHISRRYGTLNESATAAMAAYYRRMGAPRAGELMTKATISNIYRLSGRTALEFRVATSLAEPPD